MIEIPRIKIELEGIKHSVQSMLGSSNDELERMIVQTIDSTLTEDWVREQIQFAVRTCIKEAIDNVATDYRVQRAITEQISLAIEKMVKPKKEE